MCNCIISLSHVVFVHPVLELGYKKIALTLHCQWEDQQVRARTGHPFAYTRAKQINQGFILMYVNGSL